MARPAKTPREKVLELFRVYPILSKNRVAISPEVEKEFQKMVEEGVFKTAIKSVNGVTVPVYYLAEHEDWVKSFYESQEKK